MSNTNERIIRHKLGLLHLAEELGNVAQACRVMGVSRDTFYRYKAAKEDGGVQALRDKSRRKPNPKNRVEEAAEEAVVAYAVEQPAHGQVRVSNELRKRGVFILSQRRALDLASARAGLVQAALEGAGAKGDRGRAYPDRGAGGGAGEKATGR